MRDLYEVLGVPRDAGEEEIKRAYRKRARELHPDTGGDEEQFKELTTAYEVLRNPQARDNYDRYGDPRGPAGMGGGFADFGDLGDLIETFFGGFGAGGRTRATTQAGRDAIVDVVLTLEEAATGKRHEVELDVARTCDVCGGSGAAPGSGPVRCPTCNGAGAVQQVTRSLFGQVLANVTCPTCRGTGQRIADPCEGCFGEGRRAATETVPVDVPAGVGDGTRLRLSGRGEAGRNGAPSGDLYVRVRVRPHERFTRDGHDLHCDLRVGMAQASLGAEVDLSTLIDGEHEVRVPPGTQSGDVITLRRLGMPKLSSGGARGNLHVHCRVETPTQLSDEEEALLRRLAELRGEPVAAGADGRGLLGRLREAFGG
jgi:molecular chaperone DnaJ